LRPQFFDPQFAAGALAFAVGCAWVVLDSLGWYSAQQIIALYAQESILSVVARYYVAEGLAILTLVAGVSLMYRALLRSRGIMEPSSILAILAEALSSRFAVRLGVAAAVAYALVYSVVSSMIVYQPNVDFSSAYGVATTSWNAAACCGSPGTVPSLVIYVAPRAHLALQIVPIDFLFAAVIPVLVGLNIAVAVSALRSRQVRTGARWLGSVGALTGLFTGCPTCAGFFLSGAIGGLGTTTLAVALAPYQLLFVLVSLPLLLVGPFLTAFSVKRSMLAACRVPGPSQNLIRPLLVAPQSPEEKDCRD
jgi:hypothetical protein